MTDMQDHSIFENIIELHGPRYNLKFESSGEFWKVFMLCNNTWIFECNLVKVDGELNQDLWDRCYEEMFSTVDNWFTE
jgi:hypothetical protein